MDAKERWLIGQARSTLEAGTFCERDVLGLLILLREHAPAVFKFPVLTAVNNGYETSLAPHPFESLLGGELLVEAYCQDSVFRVEQRGREA
jgi:hypothetical protein